MKHDLSELGMSFALYKGQPDTVSGLKEDTICTLCGRQRRHVFALNQNDHIVNSCNSCGEPVGLRIGWVDEEPESSCCERCGATCNWPSEHTRDTVVVCYECLRGGRAGIAHETELGSVDLAHALRGLIGFGRPEIARRDALKTIVLETDEEDGSQIIGIHLPRDLLIELIRTPRHQTLQREYWPYHCKGFMAYLGRWQQEDFEKQSPGRGREWFREHMSPDRGWQDMWEWLRTNIGWSYVYQCECCGLHRVFVDSS
jgi:uncharacterized protein CbrC (UPF0167 family)